MKELQLMLIKQKFVRIVGRVTLLSHTHKMMTSDRSDVCIFNFTHYISTQWKYSETKRKTKGEILHWLTRNDFIDLQTSLTSPPPLDNTRVIVIVWRLSVILSELLCAGLCDTMFKVSSTLIWAVLTSPTDWVCHIGTLTPCVEAVA